MTSDELERKGADLYAALEGYFNDLLKSHDLPQANGTGKDVSRIVIQFLPRGMRFEDAQMLLHSANAKLAYNLPPRPPQAGDPGYDRYNIRGAIILRQNRIASAVVTVIVIPTKPGRLDTTIDDVQASLGIDAL